ncbi:MAG: hypothetical protein DRI24_01775 [Deltaproteobacteria bacterium]|nr:MAG: hypothetical protein DRI24_01775 [Deltaproteobacteria bacterium]
MARYVNASDLRIDPVDYQGAIEAGIKGYQTGQGIRDDIQQRKLGQAIATGPEDVTTDTYSGGTDQEKMLAEQGMDFTEGSGAIPEQEAGLYKDTKRKRTTAKDWKSWEDEVMKIAGSRGGPKQAEQARQHITNTQMGAFQKAAGRATNALEMGDLRTAKDHLEDAYSNIPDGNSVEVDITGGKLMATVTNEETGDTVGQKEITAEDIGNYITQLSDPKAWSAMVQSSRESDRKAGLDERKVAVDEGNLGRLVAADEEAASQFDIKETRLSSADADKMSIADRTAAVAEGRAAIEAIRSGVQNETSNAQIKQIIASMEEVVKASKRADDKAALNTKIYDEGAEQRKVDLEKTETTIETMKAEQKLAEVKQALELVELDKAGPQRDADLKKTLAQVKELEAKAKYYSNGGTSKGAKTFFSKMNDLFQRQNTASTSKMKAAEEIAKYQRRGGDIPAAIQKAYDEEVKKYDAIGGQLSQLYVDNGFNPDGTAKAEGIPSGAGGQSQAPKEALDMLAADPSDQNKAFFQQTFGYLPEGI